MSVQRSSGEATSAEDLALSRVFDAPRELVFEVWTQAEHFVRWFGPRDAEIFDCVLEARTGGVIRFSHRLPGLTLHLSGTFLEVAANERIVFTSGFVDEQGQPAPHPMFPDWPLGVSIETAVTLEDAGDGTRVTVAHRVLPAELASHPATARWLPMARVGATEVLDRLGAHLAEARKRTREVT